MIDFDKELNSEQRQVVYEGDGPCLVLSGPGSGKTRTLVYRTAYLLEKNIPADRILLLTFTKKAAQEMLERIHSLSPMGSGKVYGGTFHHTANLLLRKYCSEIGYTSSFLIIDEDDAKSMLRSVAKEIKLSLGPAVLKSIASLAVNSQQDIDNVISYHFPQIEEDFVEKIKYAIDNYQEKKLDSNLMDYDDLLVNLLKLLNIPSIGDRLSEKFLYVLVDEYQDTNTLQDKIIKKIVHKHNNILVVGDDSQSIYSFRAANINNIINFTKSYRNAKTFRIEKNYRSSEEIIEAANLLIESNTTKIEKHLKSVVGKGRDPVVMPFKNLHEQALFITDYIKQSNKLNEIAVLFRAHHHAAEIELELTSRGIPYGLRGGVKFFEQSHIKDVLAFLRLFLNFRDEPSWQRILTKYEKIGDVTAQKIIKEVISKESLGDVIKNFNAITSITSAPVSREGIANLLGIIKDSLQVEPREKIDLFNDIFYDNYLKSNFDNYFKRKSDVAKLAEIVEEYDSLQEMLDNFSLSEDFQVEDSGGSKVILSTVHQAKGLEWDTVFVINLQEGSFPHLKSLEEDLIEEERRLFYVAITRCRKNLYLTYPRYNFKNKNHSLPSRFLDEIKGRNYHHEEIIENEDEWETF